MQAEHRERLAAKDKELRQLQAELTQARRRKDRVSPATRVRPKIKCSREAAAVVPKGRREINERIYLKTNRLTGENSGL